MFQFLAECLLLAGFAAVFGLMRPKTKSAPNDVPPERTSGRANRRGSRTTERKRKPVSSDAAPQTESSGDSHVAIRWVRSLGGVALGVCFLGAVAAGGLVCCYGFPIPSVHDEFSYLLLSDTFSLGRLTNPTPPLPQHFETFHVLMSPTYASKYQPGPGMLLALGQRLLGHPALGSILSTGLAAASLYWMLRQRHSVSWSIFGALLFAFSYETQVKWTYSYWGGQLAFAGGALLIAAVLSPDRRKSWGTASLMGVGGGCLLLSRPFEGAVLFACIAIVKLIDQAGEGRLASRQTVFFWLIVALTGLPSLTFTLVYNRAVTGSATTTPYSLYESHASTAPIFVWQQEGDHDVREGDSFQLYNVLNLKVVTFRQTIRGWWDHKKKRWSQAAQMFTDHYNPVIVIPLVALIFLRPRRTLLPAGILILGVMANSVVLFCFPHYFAPFAPCLYLLCVTGWKSLLSLSQMHDYRRVVFFAVVVTHMALLTWCAFTKERTGLMDQSQTEFALRRQQVIDDLEAVQGDDLVFVHGHAMRLWNHEWVYNRADMQSAAIVWARDLGPESNEELSKAFPGRQRWILNPDLPEYEMTRYEDFLTQLEQNQARVKANPEDVEARIQGVYLQATFGDMDKAITMVDQLIEETPDSSELIWLRDDLRARDGRDTVIRPTD